MGRQTQNGVRTVFGILRANYETMFGWIRKLDFPALLLCFVCYRARVLATQVIDEKKPEVFHQIVKVVDDCAREQGAFVTAKNTKKYCINFKMHFFLVLRTILGYNSS